MLYLLKIIYSWRNQKKTFHKFLANANNNLDTLQNVLLFASSLAIVWHTYVQFPQRIMCNCVMLSACMNMSSVCNDKMWHFVQYLSFVQCNWMFMRVCACTYRNSTIHTTPQPSKLKFAYKTSFDQLLDPNMMDNEFCHFSSVFPTLVLSIETISYDY